MRRTEARQRNREALIDAALVEVAKKGYRATRLEDVADLAGLTTGAIYSIFGSKRDLLVAALARLVEEFQATIQPLTDPALSLAEVARGYAIAMYRSATDPRARERFAFELEAAAAALRDPELAIGAGQAANLWTDLCTDRTIGDRRTTRDEAARFAPAVSALVTGLAQRVVLEPGSVDEEYLADAAEALAGWDNGLWGRHQEGAQGR